MRVIPPPNKLAAVEVRITDTHVQLLNSVRPDVPALLFARGEAWREFCNHVLAGIVGENRFSNDLDISRQPGNGVLVTTRYGHQLYTEYEWEIFVMQMRDGAYVSGLSKVDALPDASPESGTGHSTVMP